MKIIMLSDFYEHSLQYQENLFVKYYLKQGHQVVFISSSFESILDYINKKKIKRREESQSVYANFTNIKLPYQLNIVNKICKFSGKRISQIFHVEKPDIIFMHNIMFNLNDIVKYKKQHTNCRIILDCHADYSNSAKNWLSLYFQHKIIKKRILCKAINYIDNIYPVTPDSMKFLNEVYNVPINRMEILPLGYDTDQVKKAIKQNKGIMIRKKFLIKEDDFLIFTGGKLDIQKRTDLLINAFIKLSDSRLNIIIIGKLINTNIAYKQKLEDLIKNNKRIHFVGWIDGECIYDYMCASDIAVFPSSQSILWQQAIGAGLPLIVGANSNYLNKNGNIIFLDNLKTTDEERIQDIAIHIKQLMGNVSLLKTMKLGAKKTAEEYLDFDRITKKTLQNKIC